MDPIPECPDRKRVTKRVVSEVLEKRIQDEPHEFHLERFGYDQLD